MDGRSSGPQENGACFLRPTAFTHKHFADVPVLGQYVENFLVGLEKGDTVQSVRGKIRAKIRQFNPTVWVLFPEGRILDVHAVANGCGYWEAQQRLLGADVVHIQDEAKGNKKNASLGEEDPNSGSKGCPWRDLMYPRFVAYEALVQELGQRLRYVVDCTIAYPQVEGAHLASQVWSYLRYPALFYYLAFHPNAPVPHVHFHCYRTPTDADRERAGTRDFLVHVWRKKKARLAKLRDGLAAVTLK